MTKGEILNEIKRTAAANGGKPLGSAKFATETGIRRDDWMGKIWARWGEALVEAGFAPNAMNAAHDEQDLHEQYSQLTLQLGRLPAKADISLKNKEGRGLPHWDTYSKRFGGRTQLLAKLRVHCAGRDDLAQVVRLCDDFTPNGGGPRKGIENDTTEIGYVYLMKSAKYFKIGKANATARRHRELAIQMPERLVLVHEIKTDDPFGIEAYWHNRFADKRKNGEWFDLRAADIAAFKRRKFM